MEKFSPYYGFISWGTLMFWGEREIVFGVVCASSQINSDFFTLVKLVRTKRKNKSV